MNHLQTCTAVMCSVPRHCYKSMIRVALECQPQCTATLLAGSLLQLDWWVGQGSEVGLEQLSYTATHIIVNPTCIFPVADQGLSRGGGG